MLYSSTVVRLKCWLLYLGLVIGCSRARSSADDYVISRTPPLRRTAEFFSSLTRPGYIRLVLVVVVVGVGC